MVSRSATLRANLVADADQMERELRRARAAVRDAEQRMESFGVTTGATERQQGRMSSMLGRARQNWLGITAAVGGGVIAFEGARRTISDLVNRASDMEESQNRISVVFGESSAAVREWIETSSTGFRMSQREAADAAGAIGTLFVSMGQTEEAASGMSTRLLELTGDLASFHNAASPEVLTALRSALVGEFEPMRRFGVALNAAAVEAKALELGLAETASEISEADKVTARYNLVVEGTAVAHGDAANTSFSYAGQMAELNAQMDNLKVQLGTALLPLMTKFVTAMNEGVGAANELTAALIRLGNVDIPGGGRLAGAAGELFGGLSRAIPGVNLPFFARDTFGVFSGSGRELPAGSVFAGDRTPGRAPLGEEFGFGFGSVIEAGTQDLNHALRATVHGLDDVVDESARVRMAFDSTQRAMNFFDAQARASAAEEEKATHGLGLYTNAVEKAEETFTDLDGKVRPLGDLFGAVTEAMQDYEAAVREEEEKRRDRIATVDQILRGSASDQALANAALGLGADQVNALLAARGGNNIPALQGAISGAVFPQGAPTQHIVIQVGDQQVGELVQDGYNWSVNHGWNPR